MYMQALLLRIIKAAPCKRTTGTACCYIRRYTSPRILSLAAYRISARSFRLVSITHKSVHRFPGFVLPGRSDDRDDAIPKRRRRSQVRMLSRLPGMDPTFPEVKQLSYSFQLFARYVTLFFFSPVYDSIV